MKFLNVCIGFMLVSSLSIAFMAAVLQMACDRDRLELLHQMLQSCCTVCHVAVVTVLTRLSIYNTQFTNQCCLVACAAIYCVHATCPRSLVQSYLIWYELNNTVPQNSVQDSKCPKFLQDINYDTPNNASKHFTFPWWEEASVQIGHQSTSH
jgi:hypothetical protein